MGDNNNMATEPIAQVLSRYFSFGRISTCLRTVGVGGFFAPSDIQCRDEQCEGGVSAKRGLGGMGGGYMSLITRSGDRLFNRYARKCYCY